MATRHILLGLLAAIGLSRCGAPDLPERSPHQEELRTRYSPEPRVRLTLTQLAIRARAPGSGVHERCDLGGALLRGREYAQAVEVLEAAAAAYPESPRAQYALGHALARTGQYDGAIEHWEQQVAYPDAVAEVAAKHRRRRLSVSQTWDGMYVITGELDPETGHVVSTALRARIQASNLDPTDGRTHGQKMADALGDVCTHSLQHGDHATSGGVKPHITVTVGYEQLRTALDTDPADDDESLHPPLPEIDGIAVDPGTIRRLACDATIIPVVLGSDSQPLDVGRATRTIPTAVRRALDLRDGGCTWPGCDAPPGWCDAHHVTHWADGGTTSLDQLRLLCRRHHTRIHEERDMNDEDLPP